MFKAIVPQEFALVEARRQFEQKYPETTARCGLRLEHAMSIARQGFVLQKLTHRDDPPFVFIVRSEHGAHIWYEVDRRAKACECYDRNMRANLCKHIFAVWLALRAQEIWNNALEVEREIEKERERRAEISLQMLEAQEMREELVTA